MKRNYVKKGIGTKISAKQLKVLEEEIKRQIPIDPYDEDQRIYGRVNRISGNHVSASVFAFDGEEVLTTIQRKRFGKERLSKGDVFSCGFYGEAEYIIREKDTAKMR